MITTSKGSIEGRARVGPLADLLPDSALMGARLVAFGAGIGNSLVIMLERRRGSPIA